MAGPRVLAVVVGSDATRGDSRSLEEPVASLRDRGVEVSLVAASEVTAEIDDNRPVMAVVQAQRLTLEVLEVIRRLDAAGVPSLAVLANHTEEHEVILLDSGAWDVVALPSSPRRLVARICSLCQHLLDRSRRGSEERLTVGELTVDPRRHEVTVAGVPVPVTRAEFALLRSLAREPGAVLAREDLLREARAQGAGSPSSLESHLSRLRVKLDAAGCTARILSVRGLGYRLVKDVPPQGLV